MIYERHYPLFHETMKGQYRRQLLRKRLVWSEGEKGVIVDHKKLTSNWVFHKKNDVSKGPDVLLFALVASSVMLSETEDRTKVDETR